MVGVIEVLYGSHDGSLSVCTVLTGSDGEPLAIRTENADERYCTSVYAVDWDSDEDLDIIIGTSSGSLFVFSGDGNGSFDPISHKLLDSSGDPLVTGAYRSDPVAVDWDGDGDLDLLSGAAMGGVFWSENISGPGEVPRMQPFSALVEPEGRAGPGTYGKRLDSMTRITVADANGDGLLDIIAGDSTTVVSPVEGISEARMWELEHDWQQEYAVLNTTYDELSSQGIDINNSEEGLRLLDAFRKLHEVRSSFLQESHTGFVWVFLRE